MLQTAKPRQATLADFTHFHGMLSRPTTAQRCIDAFSGTIVLLPNDYHGKANLPEYDYSGATLNLFSYYGLVLFSLTGLWTLLGWTRFLVARHEGNIKIDREALAKPLAAESIPDLVVHRELLDYVCDQNPGTTELYLERRFEFDFSGLLTVVMLHLHCNKGKRHLIEVYEVKNSYWRLLRQRIFATLGWFAQWLPFFVPSKPT